MSKSRQRPALGKGLAALLSERPDGDWLQHAVMVQISKINPNRFQPRTRFSEEELQSLVDSIRSEGILVPVLLRPHGDGYELIAGERRWRAAQRAGLAEIPAIIKNVGDRQALEWAIIENVQRDDLTAIESARAYQRLIQEFGLTQQEVAERIGVSRAHVSNMLRLLQLPKKVQAWVEEKRLEMGHVRPLVGLPEAEAVRLAQACMEKGWSARRMEQEAIRCAKSRPSQRRTSTQDPNVRALEEAMSRHLSAPVRIVQRGKGGELRIRFADLDQLDHVLRLLQLKVRK